MIDGSPEVLDKRCDTAMSRTALKRKRSGRAAAASVRKLHRRCTRNSRPGRVRSRTNRSERRRSVKCSQYSSGIGRRCTALTRVHGSTASIVSPFRSHRPSSFRKPNSMPMSSRSKTASSNMFPLRPAHFGCALLLLLLSMSSLQACTLLGSTPSYIAALSASVPVCRSLNTTGAPIQLPSDTNQTKYGQIQIQQLSMQADGASAATVTFIDRAGSTYPVLNSALPSNHSQLLSLQQLSTRLIVQAHIQNHTVHTFTPRLYVPFSTIISALKNTQFIGNVSNLLADSGIPATQWVRWDFGTKIVTTGSRTPVTYLYGEITNLFNATMDGGVCRPALCSTPATCAFYAKFFGKSSRVTLSWNPAMHGPLDTELVSSFSLVSHMSPFIYLYQLLQPSFTFIKPYQFTIHGNPIGTPDSFTGSLSKRKAAARRCN